MKKFFFKKTVEILILGLILVLSLILRIWKLDNVPAVVNGDEAGSILHPIQIILGKTGGIFSFTHDGSISYIAFLIKAIFLLALGLEHSLLSARLVTCFFSLGALVPFFLLLRRKVGSPIALMLTFALSGNYWFLNFSRLSWIAMDNVFFGLWSIFFLERMMRLGKLKDFILGGIFSALILYNYMGGRIYFLAIVISLLIWLFLNKKGSFKEKFIKVAIYLLLTFVVFLPQLPMIIKNKDNYTLRAKSIYIFSQETPYYGYLPQDKLHILLHQLGYSLRGFFLFDPRISAEGIENQRLLPPGHAAVNIFVSLFFWWGLVVSVFRKKGDFSWWLIMVLNLFLLQMPSVYVPSWSRGLGVLPIIYLFAGLGAENVCQFFLRKRQLALMVFGTIVVLFSASDFFIYWHWVNSERFKDTQRPTIEASEVLAWQRAQIKYGKDHLYPFTFYDWLDTSWRQINQF